MPEIITARTADGEPITLVEVKANPWFADFDGKPISVFIPTEWTPYRFSYGCNIRSVYLDKDGLAKLNSMVRAAFDVDNDLSTYDLSTSVKVNGQSLISDCSGWIVDTDAYCQEYGHKWVGGNLMVDMQAHCGICGTPEE